MKTLHTLFENNRRWAARISQDDPGFFAQLSRQQAPELLWIGCADSRVPANEIIDCRSGEVFVHRNIANVVIHTDLNCLSVIQYAVEVLKVKHIIVCGHYGCGGIAAALDDQRHGLIDNWLRHIRDVYRYHRTELDAITDPALRRERLCELNVVEQVGNVCNTTMVANAWAAGQPLHVHGWIYRLEDGLLKDLGVTATRPDEIPIDPPGPRPAHPKPEEKTMHSKQTKIVCTIAGNRCEPDFIQHLVDAGMNVARLNTAHISLEMAEKMVANIRQISDRIGILIDTKGPEVRTRHIETPIRVRTGDTICIATDPTSPAEFGVNYARFVDEVPAGSQILIDDGELGLLLERRTPGRLYCTVQNDGVIQNRKSVNVPGMRIDLPALTEKDRQFIAWATRNDIDFIAHSFVRNRDDVLAVQELLSAHKSDIKIIAKIENLEGVENLDSILDVAYGVMVARGDLGIEIPAAEVPFTQKRIIRTCIQRLKPVITATQMLHSMIENPRPTRAEVSDVANAILDGTDAVMLSGETAYGKFPIEAVRTMSDIAHAVEQQQECTPHELDPRPSTLPGNHLAQAAVDCATKLPIQAIITSTRSGDTALTCARHRGHTPIFALSENLRTVRQLSLCYGVYSFPIKIPKTTDELVKVCLKKLRAEAGIHDDKLVAFLGGGHIYSHHTNFLQIETPATLLRKLPARPQIVNAPFPTL